MGGFAACQGLDVPLGTRKATCGSVKGRAFWPKVWKPGLMSRPLRHQEWLWGQEPGLLSGTTQFRVWSGLYCLLRPWANNFSITCFVFFYLKVGIGMQPAPKEIWCRKYLTQYLLMLLYTGGSLFMLFVPSMDLGKSLAMDLGRPLLENKVLILALYRSVSQTQFKCTGA